MHIMRKSKDPSSEVLKEKYHNSNNAWSLAVRCVPLAILIFIVAPPAYSAPVYPLRLSAGNHYLVDQSNNPFFIQGDAPWYVIQRLNTADTDTYLSNRWVQGFNSILLDLHS